ncbi:MAG: glycosyltransferase family 4 protein [Anaerolineae bacterium]|nr:glycosyltransferase family 4 protein [Anaerolineae bacterium]
MRIAIDYTAAVRQRGGIGRYARNLVRALAEIDVERQYTLFVAGGHGDDGLGSWPDNFRIRSIPLSDRWLNLLWQRLRLPVPIQAVTGPLDLFHSPDFVLPPLGRTPAILTVHDLSFMRVPQCYVPAFCSYLEQAVPRAVRRARRILADSESTRRDLIELLGAAPERVTVLYPGVETRFRPVCETEVLDRVRACYRLPDQFILGLGTLQPRKNFAGLIEAFATLLAHSQDTAKHLHLVIAGEEGWMAEDVPATIARLGLDERVRLVGFVQDADLPALYTLALVFAFPTWYEGFGLPVLEAMACGTPVVAADNSSIPEAVDDAGLLVPTGDPAALAHAISTLLREPVLRERLTVAGQQQAHGFTWEKGAQQLYRIYQSFNNS